MGTWSTWSAVINQWGEICVAQYQLLATAIHESEPCVEAHGIPTRGLKDDGCSTRRRPAAALYGSLCLLLARAAREWEENQHNSRRDGFEANPTPFGKILRGELPAHILHEDHDVLCFRDIAPVQEFHALVIPKRRIEHCGCVGHSDVPLLRHMEAVALQALQAEYPALDVSAARAANVVSLGYHKPPFITVHHLHLHCVYPMPAPWYFPLARLLSFPQQYGRFYHGSDSVIEEARAAAAVT